MPKAGGGNAGEFREFLDGNNPDGRKYKVRKGAEYKVYNLFFDETKDTMQNAIVFTLSKRQKAVIIFCVLKSAMQIRFYVLKNVDGGIKNGYTKNMD